MSLNVPKSTRSNKSALQAALPKATLKKGRSLMDWIRVSKSGNFVQGDAGRRAAVTTEELAKHNTETDGWLALGGMVYNVTSYMDFHPGGIPELTRGLGTDATQLFDEVHRWVNYKSMLEPCLIGKLIENSPITQNAKQHKGSRSSVKSSSSSNFLVPSGSAVSLNSQLLPPTGKPKPRYEWFQKETTVSIAIYTRWPDMREEFVISDLTDGDQLKLTVLIQDHTYIVHMKLSGTVKNNIKVNVSRSSGMAEVIFQKAEPGTKWEELGTSLTNHSLWKKTVEIPVEFRSCRVRSMDSITHDTNLYYFEYPEGTTMRVPVGHHVHVNASVEGMEIRRSYTVVPPVLGRELSPYRQKMAAGVYLMIKIYPDGAMTQALHRLSVGDSIDISNHEGSFRLSWLDGATDLVLAGAGTGFTPTVSLLQHVLVTDPKPDMNVYFLFFNKQEKDILWKSKLDELHEKHSNFHCIHILSQPHAEWTGSRGRIRAELLEGVIPTPGAEAKPLFCACGPTPFTKEAIRLAVEMGYKEDQTHAFLA